MAEKKRTFWNFMDHFEGDKVVWIIVILLFLISIVCMFSSSSRLLRDGMTRIDLVRSQMKIVIAGLVLIILCYNIKDIRWFHWFSKFGFAISAALLALLVMRIDTGFIKSIELNGARRILQIGGIQVHVFEVVKVMMVLYLSWAIDALKRGVITRPEKKIWKKIIYLYAPFLTIFLLVITGSNSAALFIGGIMFIVIVLGGGNLKEMLLLAVSGIAALMLCFGLYTVSEGKILGRIGTGISRIFDDDDWEGQFLNSRKGTIEYQEALDAMRQPYSAKIAVHEGGFFGKGPGQSTQRYIVPDISEDFMFSFIVEEYGIIGAMLVIFLYVSLLARGSLIVKNCGSDTYAKLTVAGLCLLITGQAFLHMFVNADIGPMTGQTLPLISHGNSAFLCFCFAFGIILSFSRIATRRIEREAKAAAPLVEMHEAVVAGLDELDAFESGDMKAMDEEFEDNSDEFNEYGV